MGAFLAEKGVTLDSFKAWKSRQSVTQLGNLFDDTEERNTDEVIPLLEKIDWN